MNIVIFTENKSAGGMDTFYENLVKSWPCKNDKIIFICNKGHPGLKFLSNAFPKNTRIIPHSLLLSWDIDWVNNIKVIIIQKIIRKLLKYILLPYQYLSIKKLLKTINADFLISVNGGYPGGITTRLANIAWESIGKGKSVHSLHGLSLHNNSSYGFKKLLNIFDKYITAKHISSLSNLVCVSKSCADSLKNYPGYDDKIPTQVIYNGINLEEKNKSESILDLRYHLKLSKDSKILLMLGTYDSNKGHSHIFKAMNLVLSKYPECHLVICGDHRGLEKYLVIKSMENIMLGTKNIHLLDYMQNASYLIKQVDILLIASQITEAFGLTAIEAMKYKKPIISTDIDGLRETIGVDGDAGYCLEKNNYSSYADKIIYLLENEMIRDSMGKNGRKRVEDKFNSARMSKEYHALLLK